MAKKQTATLVLTKRQLKFISRCLKRELKSFKHLYKLGKLRACRVEEAQEICSLIDMIIALNNFADVEQTK